MSEVAFVDSSPLILLAAIGRAELLRSVADRVVVPAAVELEIRADVEDKTTPAPLRDATWIVKGAGATVSPEIAAWDLGSGESVVLALASQSPRGIAVIDDLAARHCAASLGIAMVGTVGVVVRAKRRGAITTARPIVEAVCAAGLYIADEIVERALREVGE